MPHSSGGGSGGSGGSGSFGSKKFGSRYYPGSHRYVYYDLLARSLSYYFSDTEYTKNYAESRKKRSSAISFFCILIGLLVMLAYIPFKPKKIKTNYDTTITIQDDAHVLSGDDKRVLERSFAGFLETTGITPAFLSVNIEDWADRYSSLDQYAYDAYLDRFKDEKHWLIVYSPDRNSDIWYWEGMIGNDCSRVITSGHQKEFTRKVQSGLEDSSAYTVGGAISSAFDKTGSNAMGGYTELLSIGFVVLLFGLYFLKDALKKVPEDDPKYHSYLCETDKEKPLEAHCAHCGGMYVYGLHDRCPYCGQPVENNMM